MARPRARILLPVLIGALALAAWHWRSAIFPAEPVQMRDAPCPTVSDPAGKVEPVKYDWVELCRYAGDNARIRAAGTRIETVFFGDSILDYWQDLPGAPFTPTRPNRALTGQTSQQLLLRMRQDVIALHPRVVVIQGGINDILGNTGLIGPQGYYDDIESMIDLADHHGIAVVLVSLPAAGRNAKRPDVDFPPRVAMLNRGLADLAKRRGVVFADIFTPLAGPDGLPRAGLSEDGVHLTPAGYAAIRPVLDAAIERALRGGAANRQEGIGQ